MLLPAKVHLFFSTVAAGYQGCTTPNFVTVQCHCHVVVGERTKAFNNREYVGFAQRAGDHVANPGDGSALNCGGGAARDHHATVAGGVADQDLRATLYKGSGGHR